MLLVAALRHEKLRIVQRPLHLERHNNLLRLTLEPLPDLWNRSKQQLLVGFIELALVFERETLVYGAILNVNIVDERRAVSLVVHNSEHVHVGDGMAHNFALGAETLYKQVLLLQFFRLFKLQFGGFLLHLLENMLRKLACVSFQNLASLSDRRLIVLQRLLSAARRLAVVNVILQARLVLALFDALLRYYLAARARFVEFMNQFEHGEHAACVRVGTEERAEPLVHLSRLEHTRQILVRDADARISLAVFQQHVVAWVVLLYKTVFEEQGVLLRVHHRVAYILNLRHKHLGLEPVHLFMKIARYTLLQAFRLAYIYDGVFGVVELVAARFIRHVKHDVLQPFDALFVFFLCHITCLKLSVLLCFVSRGT